MGKMQNSNSHVGYDYKAAIYEKELRKGKIHSVPRRCTYNERGICKAPKFVNRNLKCKHPELCSRYLNID